MNIQNLNFEARSQNPGDYYMGVTVKSKQKDEVILHVYLLSNHFRNVPRSHLFGLLTILAAPNTPENLLASINTDYAKLTIKKNSLLLANQLIESVLITNFSQMEYNRLLWETKYHYDFDEKSNLSAYDEFMQADVSIVVKEEALIAHITVGMQWKATSAEGSPFWYLENKNTAPTSYAALYNSLGGKWFSHEGEIGSQGTRKPMKGMSVNYTKVPLLGEEWVANKVKEGYQLLYKNYDTAYHLEEEIRAKIEDEQIATDNSAYSEQAFEALKNKDVAALQNILDKGEHPDSLKDDTGDNILHEIGTSFSAIEVEHFEMFQRLLSHGADPNHDDFRPLIHEVCYRRKEEFGNQMIELLIKHGANIDSLRGHEKQSLLQSAASNGKLWLVTHIIEKGAAVNYKDKRGKSALVSAIEFNRSTVEVLQFLLDNGADKSELYALHDGKTILDRVMYDNRTDILNYLLSLDVDINAVDSSGATPIFSCTEYGPFVMFEELIKRGADVTPHIHNILFRIEIRMCNKSFSKDIKDTAFQKLKLLHYKGYAITSYSMLEDFIDSIKGRKKIKKYEENMIVSLLEMGYKHRNEKQFLEYIHQVNTSTILNSYNKNN